MRHLQCFRYQCSEQSTDNEIEAIYTSAIARQKIFDNSQTCNTRVVVLLDEAGLPNEKTNPLKMIHYHLDHPCVATVILTNQVLDAAKTNRTNMLRQDTSAGTDLPQLISGVLFDQLEIDSGLKQDIISGLCTAINEVNAFSHRVKSDLYHRRDTVYFLRALRNTCTTANGKTFDLDRTSRSGSRPRTSRSSSSPAARR